jgi:predicted regulator of Ras-like GTPase activity (Roadblock/LC7/MglB family)
MTMNATASPGDPRRWTASVDTQLNWLLDDLVARVPHLEKAAILSRDGLAQGCSAGLGREDAEHLAALAAGVASLASGGAEYFGIGRVYQTVIESEAGFLFVAAAGEGSCLAVLASAAADPGLIGYEMAVLIKRVGRHMAVGRRVPGASGVL